MPTVISLDILRDLVLFERSLAAFVVYSYIWSLADDDGLRATLESIGAGTGFSKSAVQKAVRILNRRKLIHTEKSVHYLVTPT